MSRSGTPRGRCFHRTGSPARNRTAATAALAAVVAAGLALPLTGCPDTKKGGQTGAGNNPAPGNPDYGAALNAFYVGLTALEANEPKRAETQLTEATRLAPGEPASWANLGLLRLRNGELEEAVKHLEKARELAPDSAAIAALSGLAESRRGRPEEAMRHLRRAIEIDPSDIRTLYNLAKEVERRAGPEADAEYARLMAAIRKVQPENLAALLETTRAAARRGDAATLKENMVELARRADRWPPEAKAQFTALQAAASGSNLRLAATRAVILKNVLVRVPEYRESNAALEASEGGAGIALERPLTLPTPPEGSAAPDTGLTYSTEALPGASPVVAVRAVDPGGGPEAPVDQVMTPVPFTVGATATGTGMKAGLVLPGGTGNNGFVPFDFDYDFRTDLAAVGAKGFRLYRQGQNGAYTDVTAKTRLPASVTAGSYSGAWPADIEADGDLDLVLGTSAGQSLVLRNNGDGTFKPLPGVFPGVRGTGGFAWADVDGDGDPDAALMEPSGALRFFSNERTGIFRERAMPTVARSNVAAVTAADLNADGQLDLAVLNKEGAVVRLVDREGGAKWEDTAIVRAAAPGEYAGLLIADLDNNGGFDLVVSGGKETKAHTQIFLSDTKGVFAAALPGSPATVRATDAADLNGDGLLDLLGVGADGRAVKSIVTGTKKYHYLALRPRAKETEGDGRINSFGIGGEIRVRERLVVQTRPIDRPVVHFGLGEEKQVSAARFVWPNGAVQGEFELATDRLVFAEQRLKGSCPFLFAWDGKAFSFVTDCIWRSPLGLRINAQDTAGVSQTEDWVKIRGDQLKPRRDAARVAASDPSVAAGHGAPYYDLRITAELWETHFFDHLYLMAVDHPEGTEVWVDERFSFPPPPLTVLTTGPTRPLARAVTDTREDVTEVVAKRDGRSADWFGRGRYQGVARDHTLELDLGATLQKNKPVYLIAHGWIHPTDSSINVALGQNPSAAPPQGLSLEVPDGKGGWRAAKEGLGFPTGKVKTILLRLDDVLPPGATRLRLRTNLEIFWDHISWAEGRSGASVRRIPLTARAADLRYRGFSKVEAANTSSPEMPQDYDRLAGTTQKWRDLEGYYTRFGDVRELLAKTDDRYVIMNAGDEIALTFPAPFAPPAGWKRDFVLIGDGWVKDGDYNTSFSKTVLPLPTHASPDYATPPTRLEEDPVYRRHAKDWQTYHTRYVAPDAFRKALLPGSSGGQKSR